MSLFLTPTHQQQHNEYKNFLMEYLISCVPVLIHIFIYRPGGRLRNRLIPCTVTEERTFQEKPCIFPFQFEEKMYYGCTTAGYRDDLEPWCSTKVNAINSVHVTSGKYFGNCTKSEACPLHEKALTKLDILQSIFSPSKYFILIPVYSV